MFPRPSAKDKYRFVKMLSYVIPPNYHKDNVKSGKV